MIKFKPHQLRVEQIFKGIHVIDGHPFVAYQARVPDAFGRYQDLLTLEPFELEPAPKSGDEETASPAPKKQRPHP